MHAPTNAPVILDIIFLIKYFDKNPINKTEPHVNRAVPWKPINKSVRAKLTIKAGRYLIPNRAGI